MQLFGFAAGCRKKKKKKKKINQIGIYRFGLLFGFLLMPFGAFVFHALLAIHDIAIETKRNWGNIQVRDDMNECI